MFPRASRTIIYFLLQTVARINEKFHIRYRDQPDTLLPNEAPSPLPFTLGEQLDFSASNHDKQVDSREHDCSYRSRMRVRSLNVCLCLDKCVSAVRTYAFVPKLVIAFNVDAAHLQVTTTKKSPLSVNYRRAWQ